MYYRTKTYIAADWTGDKDAIAKLYEWNNSDYWNLDFEDAHEITKSYDSSLNCAIKSSLRDRMNASKTFVLIVGNDTKTRRAGECNYCYKNTCDNSSNKSFIDYECDKAVRDKMNIIVLYNATIIDKNKCPDIVKDVGKHIPMRFYKNGEYHWDYNGVKEALQN